MKTNILLVCTWYIPEYAGKGRLVYTSIYQYILVGVYTTSILLASLDERSPLVLGMLE